MVSVGKGDTSRPDDRCLAQNKCFFILGDSGVLSAAMADNVPPQQLGSVMGWRSLLGFGIGSFAPFSFGVVMDTTHSWGASYAVLACGGGVACLAARLLWRQHLK
ncbi:hypothetical protein SME22J_18190 [Serratia marcescens]|nr:hypothetical protein SME22J_18190 [Serratia marcescens]